jgi:hypothetical protein
MKGRIKELALEAGYLTDSFDIGHWDMPEFQNFSELLIRECIEVIRKTERTPPGFFYAKGADILEVEIYKHFGIEP